MAATATAAPSTTPTEETEPFAGYDRLRHRQILDQLRDHSQVELEAIESYERSHENRDPVLNKLRFMRGSEPFPGYDAHSSEEIVAALEEADMATIKRVRTYERKFANRRLVHNAIVRVHHERRASAPAVAVPAYQPTSYQPTSARSGR